MKKYEKIYSELKSKMSDAEIANSMLIPQDLSESEKLKLQEEITNFRLELLRNQTEEKRIYSDLLRFKFLLDDYLKNGTYHLAFSFGKKVEEYVRILNRTKKSLAEDLGIHYTRLSRVINGKEEPNIELIYRLEEHSGNLIPALYWWKLVTKKQEFCINQDKDNRSIQAQKVKNALKFSV